MKRLNFIILGLVLVLIACNNESKPKITTTETLFSEVMQIHDEVMPLMSEVHRQKKKLKIILEQNTEENNITEIIEKEIKLLEISDEKMMSWMADFDSSMKQLNNQTSIDYFTIEKTKIKQVSTLIHASIKSSKKITDNAVPTNKK